MNTGDRMLLATIAELQPASAETICKQLQSDPAQLAHAINRMSSRGFLEQDGDCYRLVPGVLDLLVYTERSAVSI